MHQLDEVCSTTVFVCAAVQKRRTHDFTKVFLVVLMALHIGHVF